MPHPTFTHAQQLQLELMMSGQLYDASGNTTLLSLLDACHERCHAYNQMRPTLLSERMAAMRELLGSTGERFKIISPFLCDFGFNISIGEDFFANAGMVILDEAPVTFGNNVFIGTGCSFFTAGHPVEAELRRAGKQYAHPIVVGNNVWISGNVTVLPGVTIGDNAVIGAGAVVTRDVDAGWVAAGNPCRPIRKP